MKLMVILLALGALGTIPKGLIKRLEDLEIRWQVVNIQIRVALPEYWEESWRLEETSFHSDSSGKPSASAGLKNCS